MVDGVQVKSMYSPGTMSGGASNDTVPARIERVMAYCGDRTQAAFARRLGVSTTRLNNVMVGQPLSRDLCYKIVRLVPGLTPHWLWDGDARGMPWELVDQLGLSRPTTDKNTAP